MERTAKIHLSAEEAELIDNTEWILTKHRVIEKVYQVFGQINERMKNELSGFDHLTGDIQCLNGKISRGENYRLLPYIILDYPSYFKKNNIFAVRTMFWWGNFLASPFIYQEIIKIKFVNNNPALLLFLQKNNFLFV